MGPKTCSGIWTGLRRHSGAETKGLLKCAYMVAGEIWYVGKKQIANGRKGKNFRHSNCLCDRMLPVEITYDLTQRDFYDSLIAHRGRSSVSKWSFRLAFGLIFLLPALGLAILEIIPKTTLATVVPLFVLAAFWAIFMWGVPWWSARTQFLQQPSAQGSKTMALDQSGIHWRWKSGQADVEWTNFIHFLESQTVFLLYTSPACFNIVPKRALSPEQTESLRDLLSEKLGAVSAAHRKKISARVIVFLAVVVSALVLLVMAMRNVR